MKDEMQHKSHKGNRRIDVEMQHKDTRRAEERMGGGVNDVSVEQVRHRNNKRISW